MVDGLDTMPLLKQQPEITSGCVLGLITASQLQQ